MQLDITPSAKARISDLIRNTGNPNSVFRIMVDGGGCQGFSYQMTLEDAPVEGDTIVRMEDATVSIDGMSIAFLHGASMDWVEDINGDRFEITNPNATSTCGCGTSFSV